MGVSLGISLDAIQKSLKSLRKICIWFESYIYIFGISNL
jgi:hypothetical protein